MMKRLRTFIRGKRPVWHKNKSYRLAGSHGSKILLAMCEGKEVGGREAIVLTRSHNGPRRLFYVL